jgi:hypothetical protein
MIFECWHDNLFSRVFRVFFCFVMKIKKCFSNQGRQTTCWRENGKVDLKLSFSWNNPQCLTYFCYKIKQWPLAGKFGEGRLDRFIPKNIFFLYIKWPSLKIHQICQNAVTDSPDSQTFAKGHFWKNVTRIRHIRTSNSPFLQIWGEWPLLI